MGNFREAIVGRRLETLLEPRDVLRIADATRCAPTAGAHFASTIWQLPRLLLKHFDIDITTIAHTRLRWQFRNLHDVSHKVRSVAALRDRSQRGWKHFEVYESTVRDSDDRWLMSCWDEVVSVTPALLRHWRQPPMCARVGAHKITRLRNWDVHALSSSVHNEAYMRSLGFSAPVVESTAVVEFGLGEVRKQIGENAAVTYLAGDFRAPIFDGEPVDVRSSVNETPFGWTFGVDFSDGTTLCSAMSGAAFREDAIDERFLIDGRNPAGVTATGAPPDASLRE